MNVFKKFILEAQVDLIKGHRLLLEGELAVAKKLVGSGTKFVKIETNEDSILAKIAHLDDEIKALQAKIDAIDAPLTVGEAVAEVQAAAAPVVAKVEADVKSDAITAKNATLAEIKKAEAAAAPVAAEVAAKL
jgi:hypothetical protein